MSDEVKAVLLTLPGIGPWTVEVFALRALGDPDAWPETDLIVRRAVERFVERARARGVGGDAGTERDPDLDLDLSKVDKALGRSITERWRPFRAYAAMHLWHAAALGARA